MITLEISIGLLVIDLLQYSLLALFVVAILISIFSKKVTRTQKTGFWLDMAFAPLGLIYEFIAWLFGGKKKHK